MGRVAFTNSARIENAPMKHMTPKSRAENGGLLQSCIFQFLANVNSCSCSLYVVVRPSVVCRLSVTFVHPTQPIEIIGNVSAPFNTLVT